MNPILLSTSFYELAVLLFVVVIKVNLPTEEISTSFELGGI